MPMPPAPGPVPQVGGAPAPPPAVPPAPITATTLPGPASTPSPVLRPTVPVHPVESQTPPTASQPGMAANLPASADDTDVIEKEWVYKAKQVVAETRHDPYLQVREINKLRADYMQKRYNKELKLPEE